MNYQQLGSSELEISELGFGCMSLELDKGQHSINKLIKAAFEGGINFFDTADLYDKGLNEEMVGKAIKPFRDEVVLATKVGNVWKDDGSGWEWKPSRELILSEVHESLRRLQTDYLDLYMLHGGTIDDPIDEIIEAFEVLKKTGKIRAYGISSIRPNTIREWVKHSSMDCVMMQYSLLDRRPEEESLDLLEKKHISVITRGTLAKGVLIDKKPEALLGYSKDEVQALQQVLTQTGYPLSAAIQYVLNHPAVASAVLGIRTKEQLEQALQAQKRVVNTNTLQTLKQILPPNRYKEHR